MNEEEFEDLKKFIEQLEYIRNACPERYCDFFAAWIAFMDHELGLMQDSRK